MSPLELKDWANALLYNQVACSLLDEFCRIYNPRYTKIFIAQPFFAFVTIVARVATRSYEKPNHCICFNGIKFLQGHIALQYTLMVYSNLLLYSSITGQLKVRG